MRGDRRGDGASDRGVSATLGVALLLAIVVMGMGVVVVIGATAVDDTREQMDSERAEKALTQFDSRSAMVALGGTDFQEVKLARGVGSEYGVDEDAGWMNVTVTNTTSGWQRTLVNETMGAVVFENGGTSLAYQGGGVWKDTEAGAVMVSPPEFHFRNATLTLPIIGVDGGSGLGDRVALTKNGTTEKRFPNPDLDENFTNPLQNGRVEVTVDSEYYRAWGRYFEQRTTGGVSYNHSAGRVTLELLKPDATRKLTRALEVSGGGSGTLVIQSGATVVVDEYDSDALAADRKSEPSTGATDSDVVTSLDVNFKGNSEIQGNLTTKGSVDFGGSKSGVTGNLRYGQGTVSGSECIDHVDGDCTKDADMGDRRTVDNQIETRIDGIEDANNNTAEDCISEDGGLRYGVGSCGSDEIELGAGDYYLDDSDLTVGNNEKLLLDTTDGDIRIALDDDREFMVSDGNVTVVGDGRVSVYATEKATVSGSDAKVWNRGWDAKQFWLYAESGSEVVIEKNGAVYNGVVYAPSDGTGGGTIKVQQKATVYGAIVAGGGSTAELGQNAEIYFDRDLQQASVFVQPTIPRVSYLHVTTNRVNVTGE